MLRTTSSAGLLRATASVVLLACAAGACSVLAERSLEDKPAEQDGVSTGTVGAAGGGGGGGGEGGGGGAGGGGAGGSCGLDMPPAPQDCPVECASCAQGTCLILCDGHSACEGMQIHCPPGLACDVQCSAGEACRNATIECPQARRCEITCAGDAACEGALIGAHDGSLVLTCSAATKACKDAQIVCGAGACSATCAALPEPPTLLCGEACSCAPCGP